MDLQSSMEKILETPPQAETNNNTTVIQESKILDELQSRSNPTSQSPPRDVCCKPATTPDRLKVPKAFKYPERYTSPTDLMMSPVSKGLLARSRKPNGLLPPSRTQPKLQSFQLQEAGLFQC